ncbi:hypothetical protein FNF28_01676 [Cafeteria roenbergensis]|uniref:PAP-associated domain-containing protein n=1 Tax=Cafeteria roenbergensis TaxID=33653 RepID=A0A5A8DZN2_CAFRO|nr:hypothetical protein FNF28_01676 [Cafeteria roenbergensis]
MTWQETPLAAVRAHRSAEKRTPHPGTRGQVGLHCPAVGIMSWDDITDPAIRREFRAWDMRRENLEAALERLLTTRDDALCKIWVAEVQRWAATDGQKDWQARTMALQYVAKAKAEGTFDWARFRCTLVNVQADGLLSLAQLLLQMMDAYKPDPGSYSAYAASAMAAAILVTNIGEVPMYGRFLKGCISLYFPPLLGRLIPPRSPTFGSAVTGLATRGSDVDVVLVGHSGEDSKTADEIRSAKESDKRGDGSSPLIYSLLMELNRSDRVFRLDGHRPHAKVPVLKLTHRPSNTNIDVVCNNVLGVHNSRLLRAYMTFDVLERPLALASIVKLWARRRNINDSTQDTLSSYAYTLMVVFFLQQRGVLPNLQAPGLLRAYEEWRGALLPAVEVNGFELRYCADDDFLAALAKCRVESEKLSMESIGSLVLGFFAYYAGVFDWERYAVSVRLGRPRPREGWEACQPRRMGIEDPFEAERDICATLGKAGKLRGQERIFSELDRARRVLHSHLSGASGAGRAAAALAELLSDEGT